MWRFTEKSHCMLMMCTFRVSNLSFYDSQNTWYLSSRFNNCKWFSVSAYVTGSKPTVTAPSTPVYDIQQSLNEYHMLNSQQLTLSTICNTELKYLTTKTKTIDRNNELRESAGEQQTVWVKTASCSQSVLSKYQSSVAGWVAQCSVLGLKVCSCVIISLTLWSAVGI